MRLRAATLTCLALTLAGCTTSADGPEELARQLAQQLAQGLSAEDLSAVPVTGTPDATAALTTALGTLGSAETATPMVSVASVAVQEGAAQVTLDWTWRLAMGEWSYRTAAQLTDGESGWQAVWDPTLIYRDLAPEETLDLDELPPPRAAILGARGAVLVTDRPVVRYGLDKSKIRPGQARASARRIAAALDIDVANFVANVTAAGDRAFVEGIVLRSGSAVPTNFAQIPGALALSDELPLAPTSDFAAPILGSVGEATAEVIEESGGAIRAGDQVGLSGLQSRYDEQLRGAPGLRVSVLPATDATPREAYVVPPRPGLPLELTLNQRLQTKAEQILADTPAAYGATAIVAIRPSTGAVLAAANGPGSNGSNIATFGQYPPGSTFKVVTALALLRSGLTPESPVECGSTTTVDGRTFSNYDDYPGSALGQISLRTAFANSCNTAMINAGAELPDGALAEAAAALGLGIDRDAGFPAYFGQVPAPTTETEAAADLIGQGRVLAAPLTMATVAASVAAGRTVTPSLIRGVQPTGGAPQEPLTAAEGRQLRELMRAVVTEGSGSVLAGLPGEVGAKTGTAEYGTASNGELPTHAWMIATQGDLAVAAFVETGQSGSATAGPLLEAFLG